MSNGTDPQDTSMPPVPTGATPTSFPRSKHSTKPAVVKAAVIIRAAAGRSKKRIAKDLGLSRNTVSSILNEAEVSTVIEQGKSDVLRMVPKATEVFNHALDQNNTRVATSVLTVVGVLKADSDRETGRITLNITLDPRPRPVEIPTIPRKDESFNESFNSADKNNWEKVR
jgi:hypothetical protein